MYRFPKKTIKGIPLNGKRVLVRADFNVPLDEKGKIASDFRIRETLPTLQYLQKHKAEVVLLAHLGRPEGKRVESLSLGSIAKTLSQLLEKEVAFVDECVGDKASQALKFIHPGKVTLLENVRFHKEEELNDRDFAEAIIRSTRPDYVVQDGFGVVHRAHASTEGISHLKPAVAGLLLEKEVTSLTTSILHPQKPLVAVIGGAKISDKLPLIERFLKTADTILIGGALANTFLYTSGVPIGKSMYEADQKNLVEKIIKRAAPEQLVLPIDVGVSKELDTHARRFDSHIDHVRAEDYILDIGPATAELFREHLMGAGTVIWNGTLGYAENSRFSKGSAVIAETLAKSYPSLESIIGGGDTADFVLEWLRTHPRRHFSHISTGGGASLELLSGKKLPGVEALISA